MRLSGKLSWVFLVSNPDAQARTTRRFAEEAHSSLARRASMPGFRPKTFRIASKMRRKAARSMPWTYVGIEPAGGILRDSIWCEDR